MGKKQNTKKLLQDKVSRVVSNSMRYLDSISDDHINDFNYIPESVQPHINHFVREGRRTFDALNDRLNNVDKSSDEYIAIQKELENIARTFINVREQVDKYKKGIGDFRGVLGSMNKGTQDSNYFVNSAVFGNQWDDMEIDKDGRFNFGVKYGEGRQERSVFKLDDMTDIVAGSSPIITEPWGSKAYVWKMAEKTKYDKDIGRPFDYDWTYKRVLNNLTEGGPNNTIGMAFTDMAGDNLSKSFAEMYEDGLKDQSFYTHPETGETLPEDTIWMKDKDNADVVSKLVAKYVTDVMKDVYGSIDEATGQIAKTKSELARELINKYSHPGRGKNIK